MVAVAGHYQVRRQYNIDGVLVIHHTYLDEYSPLQRERVG